MAAAFKDRRLDHELEVHGGAAGRRRGQDGLISRERRGSAHATLPAELPGKPRVGHYQLLFVKILILIKKVKLGNSLIEKIV